jgi:hypothetical protein
MTEPQTPLKKLPLEYYEACILEVISLQNGENLVICSPNALLDIILLVRFSAPIVAGDKNKTTAFSGNLLYSHRRNRYLLHWIGNRLQNDLAYVGTEIWSCQSRGFLLRPL